jgi:hypothetical protein
VVNPEILEKRAEDRNATRDDGTPVFGQARERERRDELTRRDPRLGHVIHHERLFGQQGHEFDGGRQLGRVEKQVVGQPVLAELPQATDEALAENIQDALVKVAGPGVTDAFVAGISDTKADVSARSALIKAAVGRNLRSVAGVLCVAIKEEPMRLECQKALLKLAQSSDLAALRDAEKAVTNETTKGALGRLIKKLEAAK